MAYTTAEERGINLELNRRKLLNAAEGKIGALAAASFNVIGNAEAVTPLGQPAGLAEAPTVAGLHCSLGQTHCLKVAVSWHTLQPVRNPRVVLGRPDGKFKRTVNARPNSYIDGKSKHMVHD